MRWSLFGGASPFDLLWKAKVALGALLVGLGVLVAVFPQLVIALLAAGAIVAGIAFIVSGLRSRRRVRRVRRGPWSVFDRTGLFDRSGLFDRWKSRL